MADSPPPYTPTDESELKPILLIDGGFGENPLPMTCPHCNKSIVTRTRYENGKQAYLISGAICAVGCFVPILWLGCCLIPFFLPGCQDVEHRCPECHHHLGYYRPM